MSDSSRSDLAPAHDEAAAVDRDAKIEQLLLAGLDHYFAAQYQQAINVWTRALFLDRTHARARAYIERARTAMAERQRQSEELLQHGVDAFRRGEGHEARRLLAAAIDGGAPSEEALVVLGRLDRLESTAPPVAPRPERARPTIALLPRDDRRRTAGVAIGVIAAAVAAAAYAFAPAIDWNAIWQAAGATSAGPRPPAAPARETAFPVPRRADAALTRARALAASGRLHDALAALDQVRATDPERAEADRLRADIQRQLLGMTRLP